MPTTPDLGIPELSQSQANPDITHNEALVLIQSLLNGVLDKDLTTPPGSPTEGDAYIVGDGSPAASGAWAGRENCITIYWGGAWRFIPGNDDSGTPIVIGARNEGMRVFVRDEGAGYVFTGSPLAWTAEAAGVSDGDKGDIIVSGGGTVWNIDADAVGSAEIAAGAVGDTELRDSAAVSVVGRAANSPGVPADIAASANDQLMRRVANALSFGDLTNGMVPVNTLSLSKLVNATQRALIGATGAGAWGEIAIAADVLSLLGYANNAAILAGIGADAKYVELAGDTMTGALTISGATLTVNPVSSGTGANINGDGLLPILTVSRYENGVGAPRNVVRKARGSLATPLVVASNDQAGTFLFDAYTGSGFVTVASLLVSVTEPTPGTGAMGARAELHATPLGSVTSSVVLRYEHATGLSMFGSNVVIDQNRLHRMRVYTVATLPTVVAGGRAAVSDSNAALTAGIGAVVAGGGANHVPVYSDAANWRIG